MRLFGRRSDAVKAAVIIIVIAAVVAWGVALAAVHRVRKTVEPYLDQNVIYPNVYSGSMNIGGMTREEAETALTEQSVAQSYSVIVNVTDGNSYLVEPKQTVTIQNLDEILDAALAYRSSSTAAYQQYQDILKAEKTEHQIEPVICVTVDEDDLQTIVDGIVADAAVPYTPISSECDQIRHVVIVDPGAPGRMLDGEAVKEKVLAAYEAMDFSEISVSCDPVNIPRSEVRSALNTVKPDYDIEPVQPVETANPEDHSITATLGIPGWSFSVSRLTDAVMETIEDGTYNQVEFGMSEVKPDDVDIVPAYHELACDPVEPYYSGGEIVGGTVGYTIDWTAAVTRIMECTWGESCTVYMDEVQPKISAEEMREKLFRDTLGSCNTAHTGEYGRTTNLTLACKAINGTVLNPGEEFSFNGIVGERTAAKGYQSAVVYVDNQSTPEPGGGICQVASTIYNAALYADLKVTQRAGHMFAVTYVKGGLDATIYWGSLDFRFVNTTDYPIRVNASVSGGYVRISIDGTNETGQYVKLSSSAVTPSSGYASAYDAYQYVYASDGTLLESNYLGRTQYKPHT